MSSNLAWQKRAQAAQECRAGGVRSIGVNDRLLERAAGHAVAGSVPVRKPFIHAGKDTQTAPAFPSVVECPAGPFSAGISRHPGPLWFTNVIPPGIRLSSTLGMPPALGMTAGGVQAVLPPAGKDHTNHCSPPVLLLFSGGESGTFDAVNN